MVFAGYKKLIFLRMIVGICTGMLLALAPARAQSWPQRPLTILVPFDAGGSADRLARGFSQFLPKELGQPVTVVDRAGAGGQMGATWFLQQPADGYTVMLTPATPFLPVNILLTGARYTLDDFTFVNAQWTDYTVLVVPNDRPFKTLKDLVDAIRATPGKLSASTDYGSVGYLSTIALMEAIGVGPKGVRIVTFDGAGAMRSALAGGQVDFSIEQGEGGEIIKKFVRPLAVFLDHRVPDFDAPPVNEALAPYGVTVPLLNGSVRTFVFPAAFKAKHPQDYATFVAAYRRTLDNPDFKAWLQTNQMAGDWIGEERTTQIIKTNFETLKSYRGLLRQ
jgi:tripartite-type tricarboxylate transporter receptor subunit TctC